MSSSQLEALKRQNDKLKEDLERKRIKTSEACKDLVDYTEKTEEPFHPKNEKSISNPYKAKGGFCTLI